MNGRDSSMDGRERAFWLGVRRALIEVIKAIEERYEVESCLLNKEQRKIQRRGIATIEMNVAMEQQLTEIDQLC